MNTSRILVCLNSDANFLALNILEYLLSKNSQVVVVTSDLKKWLQITKHLEIGKRFSIVNESDLESSYSFNYSIFCGGFISKKDSYKSLKIFLNNKNLVASKCLAVLPFEVFLPKEDDSIKRTDSLGIIYVGDLLGPRIDLESDLLINQSINEILTKREISLAVGEVLYPVFISDIARVVAKWLFSFGPYGKEVFLLGPQVSGTEFWQSNQRIIRTSAQGNIKLNYNNEAEPRYVPKNFDIETLNTNLNFSLLATYKWLSNSRPIKVPQQKIKRQIKYPKHFKLVLFLLLTVLLFPLFLILASLGMGYFSYKDFISGKSDQAINKVLISKTLFVIGREQSKFFGYVPIVGRVYKETEYISDVGQELSAAAVLAAPLIKEVNMTFNSVLGDRVYDPNPPFQQISAGLDALSQNAAVVADKTQKANKSGILLAGFVQSKVNFDKVLTFFNQGKIFTSNLPDLLGKNQRKAYLILFQNNMELRPTGGFIGSFGLLTFDGGRMTDLTVNDVYSADGQLRGHVEPPTPIKKHLNEANWWLRDSNWDPDFPTSAKRAEWFLDKEIGVQVDGVFGIDLKTVSEILKVTGPVFLADYNLDITSANLYEKTQSEAQDESFPGSHQKASFLTGLSRNLISEVEKLGEKQKLLVLATFLKDFEERHIQAFLHDDTSQRAISLLGWSGEVLEPSCGPNCYADLIGLTEANFGVNKANYFITRDVDLVVNLDQAAITRRLTLNLKNSANPALGPSGTYGVYIRAFIPKDSIPLGIKVFTGETEQGLPTDVVEVHGRQEMGSFVQVYGGQSKKIEFSWTTNIESDNNMSSYGLYIRKQAGVTDDSWRVTIGSENPALTKQGLYTYNTVLAKDYFLRLQK
jgi:hypothetical protein